MNNIFRFMQGYGYAQNWENWRNYYQKRNNTSRKLLEIVPDFIKDTEFFLNKLNDEE